MKWNCIKMIKSEVKENRKYILQNINKQDGCETLRSTYCTSRIKTSRFSKRYCLLIYWRDGYPREREKLKTLAPSSIKRRECKNRKQKNERKMKICVWCSWIKILKGNVCVAKKIKAKQSRIFKVNEAIEHAPLQSINHAWFPKSKNQSSINSLIKLTA